MSLAVILAGHGSQISPETAGIVWSYVDKLRQQGIADEVTATFWKEQTEFSQILKTVTADTVVIVPLFASSGYFVRQVIPAEMGLDGSITIKDERRIYLTRTLGEHPAITDIVRQRIVDVLQTEDLSPGDTAVAIIGHGTARSNTTRQTTRHQVDTLREERIVSQIVEAYLDDEPDIPSIFERTNSENIIAVPFFLAEGSHVSIDLPRALGIRYGDYPATTQGRKLFYTAPIGTDAVILQFIIDLINESGIAIKKSESSEWDNFPQAGVNTFLEHLAREKKLIFGQLEIHTDSVKVINSTSEVILNNPSEIRAHVRENPFRPLAFTYDLPSNWLIPVHAVRQIPPIIETIYPGTVADWSLQYQGSFVTESFSSLIQQQKGAFRVLAEIDRAKLSQFVHHVCGQCIKYPAWHQQDTESDSIPCSRACNVFLSRVKEAINDS